MNKPKKRLYLHEIFEQIGETNSIEERKQILHKYQSRCLKTILKYAFDPDIEAYYKEVPEYKENDVPIGFSYIRIDTVYSYMSKFFDKKRHGRDKRIDNKLVGILETLHKEEARVFADTVTKKLRFKGLTEFLVRQTFPSLLTKVRPE